MDALGIVAEKKLWQKSQKSHYNILNRQQEILVHFAVLESLHNLPDFHHAATILRPSQAAQRIFHLGWNGARG